MLTIFLSLFSKLNDAKSADIVSGSFDSASKVLELNVTASRGSSAFALKGGCLAVSDPVICVFSLQPIITKDYPEGEEFHVQIDLAHMRGPSPEAIKKRQLEDVGLYFLSSTEVPKLDEFSAKRFGKEKTFSDWLDLVYQGHGHVIIVGHHGTKFEFDLK